MEYLSPKKQNFVNFIKEFTFKNSRPPTFVEIMSGLNIRSLGTVNWYVNELEKENVIRRIKGKNGKRALSILEKYIDNRLPLLGVISAGYPLDVFENTEYIDVPSKYVKEENYVLKVHGDSMIGDQIRDRDYIIIQKTQTAFSGDIVVAILNNEATLKRYYKVDNKIELHPQNSEFNIIKVDKADDFKINGILLAVFRECV